MKIYSLFFLFIANSLFADDPMLEGLKRRQEGLTEGTDSSGRSGRVSSQTVVKPSGLTTVSNNEPCIEQNQTSLPLSFLTGLIQSQDDSLKVNYDRGNSSLEISGRDMIGNCSPMLDWTLRQVDLKKKKTHALEVNFKRSSGCNASDDKCTYNVAKVGSDGKVVWEEVEFEPSLEGFKNCLKHSGVMDDKNNVVESAIYKQPIKASFTGISESGDVAFVSRGPNSSQIGAKFNLLDQNKCDYYEQINEKPVSIISAQDARNQALSEQAAELAKCKSDDYKQVIGFMEQHEEFRNQLSGIRNTLIKEKAKKSAKAIGDKKYTSDDLNILDDFRTYIIEPLIQDLVTKYDLLEAAEDEATRDGLRKEIEKLKKDLTAYNKKPYFVKDHIDRLIKDGNFDEAEKVNTITIAIKTYSNLGNKKGKGTVTPDVARSRFDAQVKKFVQGLEREKEHYAIRTGEVTGTSAKFARRAKSLRFDIQLRTESYTEAIANAYTRIQQPGGDCYAYFRNTQRCVQETMEYIQQLQAKLKHANQMDANQAAKYDERVKFYSKLEAQGRKYAAENGEELPPESEDELGDKGVDSMAPQSPPGVYSFQYNNPQSQVPPMMNPGLMQNPLMGQQAFSAFGNPSPMSPYSFQFQGGYGQQPSGYWGQPYPSYNMFPMYGR